MAAHNIAQERLIFCNLVCLFLFRAPQFALFPLPSRATSLLSILPHWLPISLLLFPRLQPLLCATPRGIWQLRCATGVKGRGWMGERMNPVTKLVWCGKTDTVCSACNGASGSPMAWDGGQAPGAYSKVTLPGLGEAAQPFPSVFAGEILTFSSSLPFLSAWPLLGAGSACRTRCAAGEPAGALFVLATAVFNRHLRAPRFFHAPSHSSGAEAPS